MNPSAAKTCAICSSSRLTPALSSARLAVNVCRECGYAAATHAEDPGLRDYHAQYDHNLFLPALRATRERQARLIISLIRKNLPDADSLFDYGHGRGWFLSACRASGFKHLGGADSSLMALQWLREHEFSEFSAAPDGAVQAPVFKPQVLTILDVLEHFEPDNSRYFLENMIASLAPELQLIVIKVPLTDGLLYKIALAMSRVHFFDPIHQLYQVGTSPPHLGYYSVQAMKTFLGQAGLTVVDTIGDCEFEPEYFPDRVAPLRHFPKWVGSALGRGIRRLSNTLASHETMVFIAKPRKSALSPPHGSRE